MIIHQSLRVPRECKPLESASPPGRVSHRECISFPGGVSLRECQSPRKYVLQGVPVSQGIPVPKENQSRGNVSLREFQFPGNAINTFPGNSNINIWPVRILILIRYPENSHMSIKHHIKQLFCNCSLA